MNFHTSSTRNGLATSKITEIIMFQLWNKIHVAKNNSQVAFLVMEIATCDFKTKMDDIEFLNRLFLTPLMWTN